VWRRDALSRALGEFLFPRYLSFQARKRVFCCSGLPFFFLFFLNDILCLLSKPHPVKKYVSKEEEIGTKIG
jgi:hypothetical protein